MGRKSVASERRFQLIDAYYKCVARKGLENCTMSSIAKEAGMTPSIITHYFGTMEEMTKELINQVIEMYEGLISQQLDEISDPEERLEKLVSILFSDKILTDDFAKVYTAVLYRASRDSEFREVFSNAMQRCYSILIDAMKAVAAPKNKSRKEMKRIAVIVLALADGILIHSGISPGLVRPSIALDIARDLLESWIKDGKQTSVVAAKTSLMSTS